MQAGLIGLGYLSACLPQSAKAQQALSLNDLSSFKSPGKSWVIAGDVQADLNKANVLTTGNGAGILVNMPANHNGADLFTNEAYGDIDVELDYLIAKESNSGIYLQGNYEIQLLDSWGKQNPKPGDNGGIYQRWDESRGKGNEGYEGYAPRQNVSKAPGLWQHLKISFQAPRFDASGNKIENAKMLRVELNGVTIHENVELSGPTRGAMGSEKAVGPLRIQGDHGAVAFRNIKITPFDKARPELKNINYAVYKGRYFDTLNLSKLPPEARGSLAALSVTKINQIPDQFFIKYTGTLSVKEPGEYNLSLNVPGGRGILKINDKVLTPRGRAQRITTTLPAGDMPFEILYVKFDDWSNKSVGLNISGPGIREFAMGDVIAPNSVDPILVDAPVNTMLRSFMDIPGKRVVHAISIGSPEGVHYTYDLENGAMIQSWHGGFLDATPMWYSRGDGSSRPLGSVQYLSATIPPLNKLSSTSAAWTIDSAAQSFTTKGYKLDKSDRPTFLYKIYGVSVEDAIKPLEKGEGLKREIAVEQAIPDLYARLAVGKSISAVSNDLYLVDDKAYYIRVEDAGNAKPIIRDSEGRKELVVPVQTKISYSILF